MEEDNNKVISGFLQVMSFSIIATAAVTIASLESMSSRLGLGRTAALLTLATLCLFAVLMRLGPHGILSERSKRRAMLLLLLVHVLALCLFFPPDQFVNDKPVVTLDHAIHYYQIVRSRETLWNHAAIHSYWRCGTCG